MVPSSIMTMRYRARGSALLAAASLFVVATASPEAFAEERTLADTLRAAHARVIAGDASVAADLAVLESSADARPVADVVAYLAAKVRAAANPAAATDELRQLLARYSTSSVATRAAADLVELAPEGEDPGEIRALVGKYAVIGAAPRKDIARLLASAGARLGKRDPATASDLLTRARKAAPGSDVAKEAALTVHRVWSANTSSAPHDAESIFEEVKLAARDSSVEEQRFWIDRFLDRYRHDPRKTDVLLLRAQGIARSTSRQAAAEWLEARAKTEASAPARARLLFAAATHRWNANEDALALARFEQVVALATGVPDEQRSHYSIGRIHEAAGKFASAAESYRRARNGSDEAVAAESRWRAGWVEYLAGEFSTAAAAFGEAASRGASEGSRDALDAALYWQARSLERANAENEAKGIYAKLLTDSPDSFYAYLAEKRTGVAATLPKPESLPDAAAQPPDTAERLTRIHVLNLTGFADLAAVDVDRLVASTTPDQRLALLPSLSNAGAYSTALQLAVDLYGKRRLTEEQLYGFLYPTAFADIVQRESAAKTLDPYLVYALMKQESRFDPHAVSPASACGVMQLLPSTAQRMAGTSGGQSFDADTLFDPNVNIQLGVRYLAELAQRFANDPVFILASYNAGEKAADGWKERFERLELDELVEHITYRETRQYVKKVLANYRNYLRLYAGLRPLPSAE